MSNEELIAMIRKYVTDGKRVHKRSSYVMRECFEELSGDYVPEVQFKECMMLAGFEPTKLSKNKSHHYYKVLLIGEEVPDKYYWDGRFWLTKAGTNYHGRNDRF